MEKVRHFIGEGLSWTFTSIVVLAIGFSVAIVVATEWHNILEYAGIVAIIQWVDWLFRRP